MEASEEAKAPEPECSPRVMDGFHYSDGRRRLDRARESMRLRQESHYIQWDVTVPNRPRRLRWGVTVPSRPEDTLMQQVHQ